MNAKEFIEVVLKEQTAEDARGAYDLFLGQGGAGTFGYFRTQFNNRKKELLKDGGEFKQLVSSISKEAEKMKIMEEKEELPTLRTRNYMDGDEAPEPPKLMPTGTLFDEVISDRFTTDKDLERHLEEQGFNMSLRDKEQGGFTRKCADIVAGDPGAGKTWSRCMLAVKAKQWARENLGEDLRVGFISGEMRESEWSKELKTSPMLKELEVEFMLEQVGYHNYEEEFWKALRKYDIVIIDSLPAIISHFKMSMRANDKRTEKVMIFDFIRETLKLVEECDNNIQIINQANKDGNYKGGTELPHMMSSMSFVKVESEQRYMYFSKNRNNGLVKRKLYFSKIDGDIVFNEDHYNATYKSQADKSKDLDEFILDLTKGQNKFEDKELLIENENEDARD